MRIIFFIEFRIWTENLQTTFMENPIFKQKNKCPREISEYIIHIYPSDKFHGSFGVLYSLLWLIKILTVIFKDFL